MRPSNLLVHFINTLKFLVRSFGAKECLSRKCFPIDDEEFLGCVLCNVFNKYDSSLEVHCTPRTKAHVRCAFRMTTQEDRLDCLLLTNLRPKTESCSFEVLDDSLVKDQSMVGINDPNLRKRLWRETDSRLDQQLNYAESQNSLGSSQKSSTHQWSNQAELIV